MNGFVSDKPGETITDKLGLGGQVRELKFGSGFSGNRGRAPRNDSFHTIRYDFKPASVDASQQATLEVGGGGSNQVTISIPHSDGVGSSAFTGPRKPYAKECVLIIDHETGEVTLEKLTDNITVKKTRPEGGSRITGNKPPAPAPPSLPPAISERKNYPSLPPQTSSMSPKNSPKTEPPPAPHSKSTKESKKKVKGHANESAPTFSSAHKGRPYSPMLNVPARHSPLAHSPGHLSPNPGSNHGNGHSSSSEPWKRRPGPEAKINPPSMPSFEDLLMNDPAPVIPPPVQQTPKADPLKPQKKLTPPSRPPPEIFNDRSLSPIPKPMDITPPVVAPRPSGLIASKNQDNATAVKNELSEMSSSDDDSSSGSSSSSESESSDDDLMDVDSVPIPIAPMKHLPKLPTLPSHKPKPSTAPSMPFFDSNAPSGSSNSAHAATLISEDLQLSEESSGSDSDSD